MAEKQYLDAFKDELESFRERVRGRAKARIDKAMEEVEEVRTTRNDFCGFHQGLFYDIFL